MTAPVIGFAGMTHLGLNSAAAAAARGFPVVAFGTDAGLVEGLRRGELPVAEPGLPELLATNRARLTLTSTPGELGRCDVVYVAPDVPTDDADTSDLEPVRELIGTVRAHVAPGAVVVLLSQVPPGFTRSLPLPPARTFYQVETLIFGRAVERALHPERFIVGCADPQPPLPAALARFLGAFDCPILKMRYESAELAKISINMFLVSSVATANTLAELCERIGADWSEIVPALRLDRRIGPHAYLMPGLGIGGGNLTRDLATVKMLALQHGTDAGIIDAWNENTRHRRDWALTTVHRELLAQVPGASLAVWGLAYKEHTESTKNSPSIHLISRLRDVSVTAYDPAARLQPASTPAWLRIAASPLDACRGADGLIVMTPWPEFATIDLAQVADVLRGRVLVDPFGVLDVGRAAHLGFVHHRLGTGRLE